ncbi:MAG: alpha/beta hydrolase [Actinomycetaceae bacterium]|nr:alpha/beta hydrolase [Actinomycetaceae bacterium]
MPPRQREAAARHTHTRNDAAAASTANPAGQPRSATAASTAGQPREVREAREARDRRYHTVRVRAGRQPGFLLLNGCGLASSGWDEVAEALAGWKIIAVDRPGRRGTEAAGLFSLAGEVRFLEGLLDAEGPAVVIAHSMAAFQAEALARTRPDLVAGIVLVDPSVAPPRARDLRSAAALSRAADRLLRRRPLYRLASAAWRAGLKSQTTIPEAIDGAGWRDTWQSRPSLAAAAAESLSFSGQAAELAWLRRTRAAPTVPAVVLQAPPFMGVKALQALRGAFAAASVHRVPGSRHLMMLDAPRLIAHHARLLATRPQKS